MHGSLNSARGSLPVFTGVTGHRLARSIAGGLPQGLSSVAWVAIGTLQYSINTANVKKGGGNFASGFESI